MTSKRAVHLARLVETAGLELAATDPQERRAGRLERVQAAWLRDLNAPRTVRSAASQEASDADAAGADAVA